MKTMYLIQLENYPIFEQLRLEEALLRADTDNWCLINRGTPPAIVMGISGKPELLINKERHSLSPVPIIKRFSGGGTVFVDNNTTFVTLICNALPDLPSYPCRILKWTETLYRPVFAKYPFSLQENDYVLGNKKFGGNAQYICKKRWLHHTSLLWDYDLEEMKRLLFPPKAPAYRNNRPHEDFLCPLHPHFTSREALETAILSAVNRQFTLKEISIEHALEICERPHRKATKRLL